MSKSNHLCQFVPAFAKTNRRKESLMFTKQTNKQTEKI